MSIQWISRQAFFSPRNASFAKKGCHLLTKITRVSGAHQRERARTLRATPSAEQPAPTIREVPAALSEAERRELHAAVRRFLRERAGQPVDLRKEH